MENPCQMISGIGGCSLASGKISGYPAGSGLGSILGSACLAKEKLEEASKILAHFLPLRKNDLKDSSVLAKRKFGKMGFEYRYYPVYTYNTIDLLKAYKMFLSRIRSKGIQVLLNMKVADVNIEKNHFKVTAVHDNQKTVILTKHLILAVGRLGQNLLKSLNSRINATRRQYHLDVGVRLEFPTVLYPDIDKYHKDLKLLFDDARTFCVCKDGKIAPYRYEDLFLLEGYYNPAHKTGFTNLAIIVRIPPSWKNEIFFNEIKRRILSISAGKPVRQMLPEYLGYKSKFVFSASSISFWRWGDVNKCFPTAISKKVRTAVSHFVSNLLPKDQWWKVSVFAPEIDYRLRFPLKSDFSTIPRLYLIGDCTGRFRGILQAFCSGVICAENIIRGDSREEK